jgi:hypothetical protein
VKIFPEFGLQQFDDGTWSFTEEAKAKIDNTGFKKIYSDSILKYLECFSPAFEKAKATSEFEFILSLLRIHKEFQDVGWDPYETTLQLIPRMVSLYQKVESFETERDLQLWIYGHIVEASEPYEILMNMVRVARGLRFNTVCFPPKKWGAPQPSPGKKIQLLKEEANAVNLPKTTFPLEEIWNGNLRNAIFHSDYSIAGDEVRTMRLKAPGSYEMICYSHEQIMTYVNKALAYHDALEKIYRLNISLYKKPIQIDVHPGYSKSTNEKAWVIVRENYGVIGIRDALNHYDESKNLIPWRIWKVFPAEAAIDLNDKRVLFPPISH